jgi:radical SAM protein with 4Fe4S-binding SPASM domain
MPHLTVGDLRTTKFRTVWAENEILKQLRNKDILKPACGDCGYRHVCGGCRARSLGYLEDHLAPDVGCIRNLAEWERLKSELAYAA